MNLREFPAHQQALAILLPRRGYATDTSTQSNEGGPPPGFNINEAQKPLPKDEAKKATAVSSVADLKKSDEHTTVSQTTATAADKTDAGVNAPLSDLAADKAKTEGKALAAKKEENKKLTLGQKIKKEVAHYWDGTKLLATEVRISTKLALKMAAGYELSRRENRQVRTPLQHQDLRH